METKNVVMTDEIRAKLNGLLPFSVEAKFIYVPKVYRDEANKIPKDLWAVFYLKSLSGIDLAEMEDNAGYSSVKKENEIVFHGTSGKYRITVLKRGITGWKNVRGEDGNLIPYPSDVEKAIEMLPIALQRELQNAIQERSILTTEELQGLE